jgi:titin
MEEKANNIPIIKNPISKRKLFFWVGSSILFLVAIILTVYFIYRFQTIHTVQAALTDVAALMEKANGDNGYPQSLPSGANTNRMVEVEGGGSFDGTTYCLVGTSTNDKSIVYHINSGDKQSQGGACPAISITTKPSAVTGVATTIISAGQLGFTWNNAAGAVSYTLQCATDKDFTHIASNTMKSTQTRTCNNLDQAATYFIRVRANNSAGAGPWSSVLTEATSGLSTAPTQLSLKPISSTSISYSWSPVNGSREYVLEWSTDINFIQDLKTITTSATSGTASGLIPNTLYFFHVKAVTAGFDASHAAFSPEVYISTLART